MKIYETLKYESIRKRWCKKTSHFLLGFLVASVLILLWMFDIIISFDSLRDFLILSLQLTAILALIQAIAIARIDLFKKEEDKKEISEDFSKFLTISIWGFFGILAALLILLLLEKYYCSNLFYIFPVLTIAYVTTLFSYIFCGSLSYADHFGKGPKN